MKASILTSIAILILGAIPALILSRQLHDLRESPRTTAAAGSRTTKQPRSNPPEPTIEQQMLQLAGKPGLASTKPNELPQPARNLAESSAALDSRQLRDLIAGLRSRGEPVTQALETLAASAGRDGFDSLAGWISEAHLSPEEKTHFARGLAYPGTKQETGRWIEWIAGNLADSSSTDKVRELVGDWTQQDYQAAGTWLAANPLPDGPAKIAAVASYAVAVARLEPRTAAQWAMTLVPGPDRDSTLAAIYQNWPPDDPDGAAAFASQHGLHAEKHH